jgi:hypothetical protein
MSVSPEAIEKVLISGDLAKLDIDQRLSYYKSVCESVGLNPLTQPFDYVALNGKLRLYAKKDATDQLRRIYDVSVDEVRHDFRKEVDLYIVTALGRRGDRKDASTGAVNVSGLRGEALANAIMKAETKAKRRLTLSICGLGMLDETEVESIQHTVEPSVPTPPLALPPPATVPTVDHTPAQASEAPRPNEKKRKTKTVEGAGKPWGGEFEKRPETETLRRTEDYDGNVNGEPLVVQKTNKSTDFLFGANDVVPPEQGTSAQVESPASPPFVADDSDVPDNIGAPVQADSVAPIQADDAKPTKDEGAAIAKRIRGYKVGHDEMKKFVFKTTGASSSKDITKAQWNQVFAALDKAVDDADLQAIVGAA